MVRRNANRRHMTGDHHGRTLGEQLCWSALWTGFSARTRAIRLSFSRPVHLLSLPQGGGRPQCQRIYFQLVDRACRHGIGALQDATRCATSARDSFARAGLAQDVDRSGPLRRAPQVVVVVSPGLSRMTCWPDWKALGGQLIGSVPSPRRRRSGLRVSAV